MNSNQSNQNYVWQLELSQTVAQIRKFFLTQGFQELVIPALSASVPVEPTIIPFKTTWHQFSGAKQIFLATSPEKMLKKYLAQALRESIQTQPSNSTTANDFKTGVFTFGWSYRDMEAAGPLHQPEFLMLEWYRPHSSSPEIQADTVNLWSWLNQNTSANASPEKNPAAIFSLDNLFHEHLGCSINDIQNFDQIHRLAKKFDYEVDQTNWEELFHQLFLNLISPNLPTTGSFFLKDYPAQISPLAAKLDQQPWLADRWEWFVNGIELANGCLEPTMDDLPRLKSEQTDPQFIADSETIAQANVAGAGLGVERLAMILLGKKELPNHW